MLQPLAQAGKTAVIPPKANRKELRPYDKDLYKARHLIENFFAKLKQFRAIATGEGVECGSPRPDYRSGPSRSRTFEFGGTWVAPTAIRPRVAG